MSSFNSALRSVLRQALIDELNWTRVLPRDNRALPQPEGALGTSPDAQR
jgi:hypothetical protein